MASLRHTETSQTQDKLIDWFLYYANTAPY